MNTPKKCAGLAKSSAARYRAALCVPKVSTTTNREKIRALSVEKEPKVTYKEPPVAQSVARDNSHPMKEAQNANHVIKTVIILTKAKVRVFRVLKIQ